MLLRLASEAGRGRMFVIDDELHAEEIGRFGTRDEAVAELRRLAGISWDKPPNVAPCTGWKTCGRNYLIIEYDISREPWRELGREATLEVSAAGVRWLKGAD